MDSYSDQSLNLDELIFQLPSFIKAQEDGITEEELTEQKERVVILLKKIEQEFTPKQIEEVRELLIEVSVLVAIDQHSQI